MGRAGSGDAVDVRAQWIRDNAVDVALVLDYLREHEEDMATLVTLARIEHQVAAIRAVAS